MSIAIGSSVPGTGRVPAASATCRAFILSPNASSTAGGGPTNTAPASATARANAGLLAQEPVARVDRLRARAAQRVEDRRRCSGTSPSPAAARRSTASSASVTCGRVAVRLGVHGHRPDAEATCTCASRGAQSRPGWRPEPSRTACSAPISLMYSNGDGPLVDLHEVFLGPCGGAEWSPSPPLPPPCFSSQRCATTSSGGWRMRVRTARISDPPMTTIASGFCVCAPMPFDSAAGKRPSMATSVVMRHGRNRFSAASRAACSIEWPSDVAEALEVGHDEDRVLDRDAEDGDEPHRRRDREVHAA